MNRYPVWKYLIIVVVLIVGVLYALPNLYGEDPAIQVSPTRGTVVDESTRIRVEGLLKGAGLPVKAVERSESMLLARFPDTDVQLEAYDVLHRELGNDYIVALNLAPTTPAWLIALNAKPMYLGLDLRGGVHFLMEVDMEAAVRLAEERYLGDLRTLLREEKIRYLSIGKRSGGGLEIAFRSPADRETGAKLIAKEFNSLVLNKSGDENILAVTLSEKEIREVKEFALQQNITTLRNRVNELGVAEPIIQQQGVDRIVVQLPGVQDTARAKEILGATATLEFRLVDSGHDVQDAVSGLI